MYIYIYKCIYICIYIYTLKLKTYVHYHGIIKMICIYIHMHDLYINAPVYMYIIKDDNVCMTWLEMA